MFAAWNDLRIHLLKLMEIMNVVDVRMVSVCADSWQHTKRVGCSSGRMIG